MSDHLRVHVDGRIGRITLQRPDRRNALSLELLNDLLEELHALSARRDVGVVVLEGEGPAFSAGHDMTEMLDREPGYYDHLFAASTEVMRRIGSLPQPVIAKVQGLATAAGCQLVAACDLVVAANTAQFATPGVKIGLFCSTPMVPLSRSIGRKRAMQMLLTGDPIAATVAQEWGLVNTVVPDDQLERATVDLAERILQFSSEVIALGKRAFYEQVDLDEETAYGHARKVMADNARMEHAQEGMGAFLDKREPVWPNAADADAT